MAKAIVAILWLIIIANLVVPFAGEYSVYLKWLGVVLLVAHLIEYFVFSAKIKALGDSTAKAFLMTMIFGVAYING